jgi:adenylate cyclase
MSDDVRGARAGPISAADPSPSRGLLWGCARRWPFASFFILVVLSNAVGSYFNIEYNLRLIVRHFLDDAQRAAFWRVLYAYNAAAYAICFTLIIYFLRPLASCRDDLLAGHAVTPARKAECQKLLINLPLYQVLLTLLGWLPGAVVFPWGICALGGWEGARPIWLHFAVSFSISALLTTMQTFFLLEAFLIEALYPLFFQQDRPAEVRGAVRVRLGWRVFLLWASIAVVPILALLAVCLNFTEDRPESFADLRALGLGVALVGVPMSGFLMGMMGRSLVRWVRLHSTATEDVARGNFRVRIGDRRPDEWGQLTDRFNDMAAALERGERLRETFGQFVSPDIRDEILENYPDLGGEVQEVTVLFADIRGFTRRTAGGPPEAAVDLLNRFFTLAVAAVEGQGGWVNKFLGDGFLALFGAPRRREDHASLALRAARDLLDRLDQLAVELTARGEQPLRIGIGIHTGPALVGCVGASLQAPLEVPAVRHVRREFTAIGDTVNLAQRLEELTKREGGPILLSSETMRRLTEPDAGESLERIGPVSIPGQEGDWILYRADGRALRPRKTS